MDERLEARRLRYFLQVVESGSVRGAADALAMDASAVSRAIAGLEQECGARLFERRGRGVAPTEPGRLLAEYLRRRQTDKLNLLAQIDSIRKVETGHVDLIAGEGYVDWLMRKCLRSFMAAHPGVTVDLDVGSTDEIVEAVVSERAHVGVLFRPPRDARLNSHHSLPHPIRAWFPRSHPLARLDRPLRLADLAPYPGAVLHRGFGVRQHIAAAEISEDVRLAFALTTSSFDAVASFVAAGLGYALATSLALSESEAEQVVSLPMKNALLHRGRSYVVSRQGRQLPPAAAELLQAILTQMRGGQLKI